MLGACDSNCSRIQIELRNADGRSITISPEQQSIVIVGGPAAYSGRHTAEISVPGCPTGTCQVGFVLLRKGAASVPQSNCDEYIVNDAMPGSQLNVRANADSESKILAKLDLGKRGLCRYGESQKVDDATWVRVQVDGVRGWVNYKYVHKAE